MRLLRSKKKARVEMTPLIDVVFLLLVFFIYSMLIMDVHRGTRVALPSSENAELEQASELSLTVLSDSSLILGETPVTLQQLTERLAIEVRRAPALILQIFADGKLPYQQLYFVLDAVKAAGVNRISLQARGTSEK